MPATSVIGIEMARLPWGSTAARKPRSPGCTTAERAMGTPLVSAWRATLPTSSAWPSVSATIISGVTAASSTEIRPRCSGFRIEPGDSAATGT